MEGLKEAFNKICKANDEMIKAGKGFNNRCFLIKEDGKIDILDLYMKTKEDKNSARASLFREIESQKAMGYIIVLRMMITNAEGKKENCIFRGLYSMDDKINEKVTYEENKIIARERLFGREEDDPADFWDLWNSGDIDAQ